MKKLLLQLFMLAKWVFYGLIIQCFSFSLLLAYEGSAQNIKSVKDYELSINFKENSIFEVFKKIEQETGYYFVYDKSISGENIAYSKNYNKRSSVADVLLDISEKYDLKFRQINKSIIVAKKTDKVPEKERLEVILQATTVTGKVTSDDSPGGLPGVNVIVKGTSQGTITDVNGDYRIDVQSTDAVLAFSSIGFVTEEIVVGDRTVINIHLAPDITELQEIIVTGYTEQRKRDITGAVAVVDVDNMQRIKAPSVSQKLEGQASGITTSTSGQPGEGTNIRIRGIGSFVDNEPLWIIDGVQSTDRGMTWLNPNDVESIQILKDASAYSIYGSRASGGVIVVTTKKGKAGTIKVTYDGYFGVNETVGNYDETMITNPYDLAEAYKQYYENSAAGLSKDSYYYQYALDGTLPDFIYPIGNLSSDGQSVVTTDYSKDPPTTSSMPLSSYSYYDNLIMRANKEGTNWWDRVFKTGILTEHTINASGGSEKSTFNISAGYLDQKGTMIHTSFNRYSVRANSQFKLGKLTVGENLMLARSETIGIVGNNNDNENAITATMLMHPTVPVYDIEGNFAGGKSTGFGNRGNAVALMTQNKDNTTTTNKIFGNFYGELGFTDWLKFRSTLGFDYNNSVFVGFNYPNPEDQEPNNSDGLSEDWEYNFLWQWTNTLEFSKRIGERHQVSVLVGYEALKNQNRRLEADLNSYFSYDPAVWYINTAIGDPSTRAVLSRGGPSSLASGFGKIDYSFDDKYLVSFTLRRDGSSKFSSSNRWGTFPAGSIGWRVSSEPFMNGITVISDLKIRAGFGVSGNEKIANNNGFNRYGGGPNSSFYAIGGGNSLIRGYALTDRGNPNTKWEKNSTYNAGIDLSLLDDKIGLVVDLYKRTTEDLLVQPEVAGTIGSASVPFQNVASMENRGIDVSLSYRGNITSDLSWNTSIVATHYKNEITKVSEDNIEFFDNAGVDLPAQTILHRKGHSVGQFYGLKYTGVIRSDSEADNLPDKPGGNFAGGWKFEDVNGDGQITEADDRVFIGNPHPDLTLGWNLGFDYKNFDLSVFVFSSIGNDIYNYHKYFYETGRWSSNFSKRVLTDTWTPERTDAELPQLNADNNTSAGVPSSYYVEDGSYVRLKNFQIGYNLPETALSSIGVASLRIYLQAQNLFTITGYSGIDPALSNVNIGSDRENSIVMGVDLGNYPANRTYAIGLSVGF